MKIQNQSTTTCYFCWFNEFCTQTNQHHFSEQRLLKRNESLYKCNSRFNHLYIIQKGAIKTHQSGINGKELIRGFYFPSEILGCEAIALGYYPISATALTETIVCSIPYEKFLASISNAPNLQKETLELISMQLSHGSYILSATAEQRLVAFFFDLNKRLNREHYKSEFFLPMSRQSIGNYLGLTAETISRICSKLTKLNIIASNRKHIKLLKPAMLEKILDGCVTINY